MAEPLHHHDPIDSPEDTPPSAPVEDGSGELAPDGTMTLEDIQESYASYATWIARLDWLDRLITGRYRREQFSRARGRVLDVACGTGTNFRYLPESVDLVGIDISEEMLAEARDELDRLDREGRVARMDAQALEFDDDSFETVVSSFSTCTFPDPTAALQEMERVCAPGGRILLVEHGRSDVDLVARYQEWRADAHYQKAGCRVTQEPLEVVRRAGLSIDESETGQFGRITSIVSEC